MPSRILFSTSELFTFAMTLSSPFGPSQDVSTCPHCVPDSCSTRRGVPDIKVFDISAFERSAGFCRCVDGGGWATPVNVSTIFVLLF